MKNFSFKVTQEVLNLGVKIVTARISGARNSKDTPEVNDYIAKELENIRNQWVGKDWEEDEIINGFRDLHEKVGKKNKDFHASPEVLLKLFLERERFPRINTVVDLYNLVSLKSKLSLGAHDIEKINGNVTLKITNGSEKFTQLGKTTPAQIFPGEYAYTDDANNVICRLEVVQSAFTLVTPETSDVLLIIQGNQNTDFSYVENTAKEVCTLITKFCGGNWSLFTN